MPSLYISMFSRSPKEKKKDCLITVFKNLKADSFTLTERIQIILPVQLCRSPSYPGLQEQLNDPWVLLHQAFHDSYYLQRCTHLCLKNKPSKFKGAGTRKDKHKHGKSTLGNLSTRR